MPAATPASFARKGVRKVESDHLFPTPGSSTLKVDPGRGASARGLPTWVAALIRRHGSRKAEAIARCAATQPIPAACARDAIVAQ